ncbi:hypothetical protein [Roseomonas elaeocarpi]|uniref:Lipoprotein n=1 Tax=Roseomonas elaeocarpi TaxID=907779 RepID=A0ABV6JRN3_9PROT
MPLPRSSAPALPLATALLLLGACSLPSQSEPQGRAAAVSAAGGIATLAPAEPIAVNESETPGGNYTVFNVTPRIEQRPADAPYPLLLTGLVAARSHADPTQRIFRAIFAITYRAGEGDQNGGQDGARGTAKPGTAQSGTAQGATQASSQVAPQAATPGRQRFTSILIGRHVPGPLREVDHDLRCDAPRNCLYTETLATFLPEADLRAAATADRALAFRLDGTLPVEGAIPPDQIRALITRIDSPAR